MSTYLYRGDARAPGTLLQHTGFVMRLIKLRVVVVDVNDVESHRDGVAEVVTGGGLHCRDLWTSIRTITLLHLYTLYCKCK